MSGLPFITIDPPGARDLDQALHIMRLDGGGHRVSYAIADVAAFVAPGDEADTFAWGQGVTLYHPGVPEAAEASGGSEGRKRPPEVGPPSKSQEPLYPTVVERASLLPEQDRPAVLWTLDLDERGALTTVDVRRVERIRSTAQHTYEDVPEPVMTLLREVGERRLTLERERGGVSLPTPEQEVDADGTISYRAPLDAEQFNAQISLLTGIAAADLMLRAGTGLLRTLAPAEPEAIAHLRSVASALGRPWEEKTDYGDYIRSLDPFATPDAAILRAATRVLRGAGYLAFDSEPPAHARHAAIAEEYAHVTAPLRRLADRYATECALAAHAGTPVPDWVRERLSELPAVMEGAERHASQIERDAVDAAEARALAGRVGEVFEAVVIADGVVQLRDPAVRAPVDGEPPLGATIRVRLESVGPVRFAAA